MRIKATDIRDGSLIDFFEVETDDFGHACDESAERLGDSHPNLYPKHVLLVEVDEHGNEIPNDTSHGIQSETY